MVGGVLQLVGLVALMMWGCEALLALLSRLGGKRQRTVLLARLTDDRGADEGPCPWPRIEPEVERLRERGAL